MKKLVPLLLLLSPTFLMGADDRPNVLMLLVDDLKPAMGSYGDAAARTPHLDRLADSGMRFELAYCNQAVCAPSRFTLMLGAHSTTTGLYGLGSELRAAFPDAVTLPQHFAAHGYRTESLGKVFHEGHGNEGDPESFSVPHFKEKVIEYVDPKSTQGGQLTREEAYFTNQRLGEIRSLPRGAAFEAPDVEDEAYADGRVATETVKRLQAAKGRIEADGTPFFIVAGFARPHLPFSAPKAYWDLYDPADLPMPEHVELPINSPSAAQKVGGEICNYFPVADHEDYRAGDIIDEDLARELIHGYYASVSYVDAQIGRVLDGLEELGLDDDTIVVLWGDHGFHLGDLGLWTKHTNYEQANRIPILVRAPGVTQPGSSTRQPAESVDLYPTLAELAGLPAPAGPQPVDGVSLVPVLKDGSKRVRDHAFHAYPKAKMGRAIRTERYRLVEWRQPGSPEETAEWELYDYDTDPLETRNLAPEQPERVEELKKILRRHPEPLPKTGRRSSAAAAPELRSPAIADQPLQIQAEFQAGKGHEDRPSGVVLAQGGREQGYALRCANGKVFFDVRVDGSVHSLARPLPKAGRIRVHARLNAEEMRLQVGGGEAARVESPGLIPRNPTDPLSLRSDVRTAVGNYPTPSAFVGTLHSVEVVAGDDRVSWSR